MTQHADSPEQDAPQGSELIDQFFKSQGQSIPANYRSGFCRDCRPPQCG